MTRHLLLPMQPTPNGRLHIGHGGGPYLRADVLARALRRDGHQAAIITGSDAYENWVLADGLTSGRTPEQTCAHFHSGIGDDLHRLDIHLDTWIDPLSDSHRVPYIAFHERLHQQLTTTGGAVLTRERIPVNTRTGQPLVGTWIAGRCPTCQQPCGGNTCTACGDHFQPEQLLDAHSRLDHDPIRWTDHPNWFLQPTDLNTVLTALTRTGLADPFLTPIRRYLTRPTPRIRLTQPGGWGIPSRHAPAGSVLANTYYAYCLYSAEHYAASLSPDEPHPFTTESDITTIGLFGTDNSIAGLLTPHVIADATGLYQPFDHTIVNHMLHLEGRKCSTSKQHGIWIDDIRNVLSSDELRYLLAHLPLDHHVTDLTTTHIVDQVNRLRRWTNIVLSTPPDSYTRQQPTTAIRHDAAHQALTRQRALLHPAHVDLAEAARDIDRWLFDAAPDPHSTSAPTTWLHDTALLTYPIMPTLATHLWHALGHPGTPATTNSALNRQAQANAAGEPTLTRSQPLTTNELRRHVHLGDVSA
ncbi:Class I tRNA ligase family protein [Frankia sp. AiPs1]|uniref:class I tRNA ligase family protein n=1 Tax=Frankia sp. AiPa1 TaxID=573492 RepID=UPI00202B9FD3|nr:class I tRNA ligase family protein [Frankia sp. AiPa1]MCL9759253.1 class I tRNA ligase family protein [Frankia sp. AiPa1]